MKKKRDTHHFAHLENSPRLQRLLKALSKKEWRSTMSLQTRAIICSVSTSMSELCRNGIDYEIRRKEEAL